MFDIFPRALASVASVLFPIFASYKALQTADPAQLTPWLMYWVVLACVVLIESWTDWLLVWIPFYHYLRLFGLLYLVLPQTQGARVLYQTQIHPWLQHHEGRIDELIGSAHDRVRSAGMAYLRRAIAYARAALGLPEAAPAAAGAPSSAAATPQPAASAASYTQALLSRFSLPSARWPGGAGIPDSDTTTTGSGGAPPGIYSLFSGAIDRALNAAASGPGAPSTTTPDPAQRDMLRDRLRSLLTALDRTDVLGSGSGSGESDEASELRKSRSEPDFVRIDADSDAEDEDGLRRRVPQAAAAGDKSPTGGSGGSWMPWGWGGSGGSNTAAEGPGTSSGTSK